MRRHFTYEAEPFEAYTDFELEFEINRSSRDYIKWVQSSLNRIIGARLVVDGISGSKTRAAVQTFQRRKRLTADGIVGPITERALIAAGAGQPPGGAGGAPSSGTPGTGSPSSAIDTFLPYSGPGYESKYTSSDLRFNQYGRSEAILALQWIAREWQRKYPNGPKLYIGPISKKGGGTLCYSDGMCHAEHKDGLDIDIRPVRNDQSKGGLTFNDPSYSRQLTQEFVDLAWSNRCVPVEKILFNDRVVNRVEDSSGHDDHLHVSFKAPSGSLPAECRSTGSVYRWELSEELEQDREEFLDDFWGSFTKSRIEDRTAFTPKDRRKGVRDIKKVYALVLHQMAFSRGNEPKRYDTVTAHFAILPDGKITQLHPETALLWASNGFNACSVAVEFAGNFPNTKGKCWAAKKFGCHKLTPEQIEAGRYLVEYLIKKLGLTHIFAHRQAWDSRENCPGPDIWYNVGQWAVEKHGLKDGGPGFKVGSGHPVPDAWRTWGSIKRDPEIAWELSNEFEAGEFYDGEFAAEEEFSLSSLPASVIRALRNGMESVALKLAIANGHRDENDLTNMIFFRRHQERRERKLSKGERNFDQLAREWIDIRDRLVRPALRGLATVSSAPSKPASTGGAKPVEKYCTPVNPRGKNEDLLMKHLAPFVQKYRGDIPIDFLLGWIAVESAGYIEATTRQCERGYFQLHPEEARRVGVDDPQRLSTDPEYSVKMGIEMVKGKMARAEQLGFARGTDLNRHFAKLLHWLPAYVPILVKLWNASGASPRTWKGFSDFVAKNRDEIVKAMAKQYPKNNLLAILRTKPGESNADPVRGIMGVDKVFVRGPFWEERLRKMGALSGINEMEMFEEPGDPESIQEEAPSIGPMTAVLKWLPDWGKQNLYTRSEATKVPGGGIYIAVDSRDTNKPKLLKVGVASTFKGRLGHSTYVNMEKKYSPYLKFYLAYILRGRMGSLGIGGSEEAIQHAIARTLYRAKEPLPEHKTPFNVLKVLAPSLIVNILPLALVDHLHRSYVAAGIDPRGQPIPGPYSAPPRPISLVLDPATHPKWEIRVPEALTRPSPRRRAGRLINRFPQYARNVNDSTQG